MIATTTALVWHTVGREHLRDDTGRFDVWLAPVYGRWVAVDGDRGRVARRPTLEAAQAWCEAATATRIGDAA